MLVPYSNILYICYKMIGAKWPFLCGMAIKPNSNSGFRPSHWCRKNLFLSICQPIMRAFLTYFGLFNKLNGISVKFCSYFLYMSCMYNVINMSYAHFPEARLQFATSIKSMLKISWCHTPVFFLSRMYSLNILKCIHVHGIYLIAH